MDRFVIGQPLPEDLASLIHHVELSKAGWRERALELLVLAAVAEQDQGTSYAGISTAVNARLAGPLGQAQIAQILEKLQSSGRVIRQAPDKFALSEATRGDLHDLLEEGEARTAAVKAEFDRVFGNLHSGFSISWENFQNDLLLPLVSELGAKTYQVLTGDQIEIEEASSYLAFLAKVPLKERKAVADRIVRFVDPTSQPVRSYVLRLLNTAFLVRAVTLPEGAMAKVVSRTRRRLKLRVFLDTNFLFSLIGLHENPADDVVKALHDLIEKMTSRVDVKLYMLPCTMDEARKTIASYEARLKGFHFSRQTRRMLDDETVKLSGITQKYIQDSLNAERPLSAKQYFKPYVDNFITVARSKGVELYNAPLDSLRMDQEVLDDVVDRMEFEKRNRPKERQKSYELVLHDMMLWHFTKRKRSFSVESPLDAESWVATIDFGLLGFDAYKVKRAGGGPPVCIHPTVLLQILQLWVPSSEQLDAAVMNSLRPMLPHIFDTEAERVTIRILGALSRFENADDLGQDTITDILLNDAVRTRVAATEDIEDDIEIIKSALVKQNRILESERRRLRKEAEGLEVQVRSREAEVSKLAIKVEQLEEARKEERGRFSEEERERVRIEERFIRTRRRAEHLECILAGSVATGISGVASWRLGLLVTELLGSHPLVVWTLGLLLSLLGGFGFMAGWMAVRDQELREQPTGKLIRRIATWLGALLGAALIAVVVELIATDIVRRP